MNADDNLENTIHRAFVEQRARDRLAAPDFSDCTAGMQPRRRDHRATVFPRFLAAGGVVAAITVAFWLMRHPNEKAATAGLVSVDSPTETLLTMEFGWKGLDSQGLGKWESPTDFLLEFNQAVAEPSGDA